MYRNINNYYFSRPNYSRYVVYFSNPSSDIISIIESKPYTDFPGHRASKSEIKKAEKVLGTKFSDEYKSYLSNFGPGAIHGSEFMGLGPVDRLNVVKQTQTAHAENPEIPSGWYLVEDLGIDGALVWQAPSGELYQSLPGNPVRKVSNSLSEYINKLN